MLLNLLIFANIFGNISGAPRRTGAPLAVRALSAVCYTTVCILMPGDSHDHLEINVKSRWGNILPLCKLPIEITTFRL